MKKGEEESPRVSLVRGLMRKCRAPLGIFLAKWEAAAANFGTGDTGVQDGQLRGSRCEFKQPVRHMQKKVHSWRLHRLARGAGAELLLH